MPFVKYDPTETAIKLNENCKKVLQDRLEVAFFTKGEIHEEALLYTVGMNPCVGIILRGEVELEKNKDEDEDADDASTREEKNETVMVQFVALDHNSGFAALERQAIAKAKKESKLEEISNIVDQYSETALQKLFLVILDDDNFKAYENVKIKKLHLLQSYFIRCKPQDKNDLQHLASTAIVERLATKEKLLATADDETPLHIADHYSRQCIEEDEKTESDQNSTMECFLQITASDVLNVIYNHKLPNDHSLELPSVSHKALQSPRSPALSPSSTATSSASSAPTKTASIKRQKLEEADKDHEKRPPPTFLDDKVAKRKPASGPGQDGSDEQKITLPRSRTPTP